MFYQNVVAYCEENNLSIHAFEKKCGLGNGVVGRWKDNKSLPALTTVQKIAEATRIPVEKWIK